MREAEPQEQHPEISDELRRKAEIIALFMGGDYNMTVGVGPWGSGWHWDFVKNHVNMDAKDLATETDDVVKGVAAHEGNHRLISRAENVQDLWREPGFAFGYNAVEDPRANQGGMKFKPGIKDWMQAYIERDLDSGGGLDYEGIERDTENSLGYVPDFMKWGAEMIRYWHGKELSGEIQTEDDKRKFLDGIKDESVRELVGKTLQSFEDYYKTLPDSKDEMDVQRKAKEASKNFRDNIWPDYQELVKKSYEDHSKAKMAEDMMNQDDQGEKQQGSSQGQQDNDQQKQDNNDSQPSQNSSNTQEGQGSKDGKNEEKQGGEGNEKGSLSQDIRSEIEQKMNDSEKNSENSQNTSDQSQADEGEEPGEDQKTGNKPGTKKIPWDKLSDEAKQAIQQAFDNLPKEKQEEYRQKAKEELENAEDQANEKLRGKMNDPRYTQTNKEDKDDKTQKAERQRNQEQAEKFLKDMERMVEEAKRNIPENPYTEYLAMPDVSYIRRRMEVDFKKVFEPTEDPDIRHSSTGLRPSMGKAMQMEADPRRSNIFESKGRPTERKYRFMFLVDLSGSMLGEKIEETFKSLLPIVENMNKFGIEFGIAGFTTNFGHDAIKIYKEFDEKKLNRESRDEIGKIMQECGGGTPTKQATEASLKLLKRRMSQVNIGHNYFITLTDGQPDGGGQELLKYLEQTKDRSIVTAGFGIGPLTDFVNESYPKMPTEVRAAIARELKKNTDEVSSSFENSSEFGRAFAIIIGYMIKRPELFFK